MAATYPLEIVQADRWQKANKDLTGFCVLATELEKQDWDPSVRSLVNFPDVLSMMSEKLDLTIKTRRCVSRAASGRDGTQFRSCVAKRRLREISRATSSRRSLSKLRPRRIPRQLHRRKR